MKFIVKKQMIKEPTEEIIFMNVMTLLCEYTGLRADKAYSIEHKEEDIPPMTLNENYKNISKILEKVFKKEILIEKLIEELKNILNIEIKYTKNKNIQWENIKNIDSLMTYINAYIN
jgi:hypothetical protein